MGTLFSAFSGDDEVIENVESDNEKIDPKQVNQIVSNINFNDSDLDDYLSQKEDDPCGLYIDGFSTEWSKKEIRAFLKKNQIKYSKVNKDEGLSYATIYFDSTLDKSNAYHTLTTVRFEKMILYVVPLESNFSITQEKCKKLQNRNKIKKDIVDRVTPWHSIDYAEQLRQKVFKYSKIMEKLSNTRSFELINIIESDHLKYYVNDIELAIGRNSSKKIAVGFNFGSKKDDDIAEISNCINIPECAIILSNRVRKFVFKSGYSPYNRLKMTNLWKFVRIKTTNDNKIMLILGTYGKIPTDELISKLIQEFNDIDSLYYAETAEQESFGASFKLHHLNGAEYLSDQIDGINYPIYPTTTFPTSTTMFEKIIQQIVLLGSLDDQTIVIDIDAGIGLYSFPISKIVSKVIAFEKNEALFKNLISNDEFNQIQNVEFQNGYVEDLIDTIKPLRNQKVVVLVHAPHSGIRKKALYAIQTIPQLAKIVFVSTNPEKLIPDCNNIFLNYNSQSVSRFYIDSYVAIDTAPHTDKATVVLSILC